MKNKIQSAVKSIAYALASALGLSFAACVAQAAATVTQTTTTASDGSGDTVVTFTIPAGSTESGTTTWTVPAGVTSIRYLVVGGGGSGGRSGNAHGGGGGGAGEMIDSSSSVTAGTEIQIVIGEGGAGITGTSSAGNNGGNTKLTIGSSIEPKTITANGGGGGGYNGKGKDGGSGGGAGCVQASGGISATYSGGASIVTSGLGNAGGSAVRGSAQKGAGGGGAGGLGNDYDSSDNGKGGAGKQSDITGSYEWYAAGGGGSGTGNGSGSYGAGGEGGGGTGSHYVTTVLTYNPAREATAGSTYGSGGGGSCLNVATSSSGAGCEGVVIIRYATTSTTTYIWAKETSESFYWNNRNNWNPNTGYPQTGDVAAFSSDSLVMLNTAPSVERMEITPDSTVTLKLSDNNVYNRTLTVSDTTDLLTSGSRLAIVGNDKKLTVAGTTSGWDGGNASGSYFSTLSAGSVLELANNAGYTGHLQFSTTTEGLSATIYAHDGANTVQDVRAHCKNGLLNVAVVDGSLTARNIAGNTSANNGGSTLNFGLTNATLSATNIRGYEASGSKYTNLKFDIQLGETPSTTTPVVAASGTLEMYGATYASYGVNIDATRAPLGTYTILSAGTLTMTGDGDPLADDPPEESDGTITENASGTLWSWSVDVGEGRKWTLTRTANAVTLTIENASRSIADATVTFSPASYTYAAVDLVKPTVTVTVGGVTLSSSDYDVSWSPSTLRYANDYTATITGKGSYTGTKTATFYVLAATISEVQLASSSVPYDGQSHTPVVMSVTANGKTLTLDQDLGCKWTVVYKRGDEVTEDFTSAGEITVEVTGNTSLAETASATFTITKAAATITGLTIQSWAEDETPQSPTCTVTPAGASATYKYYSDAGCVTEVFKPTTQVGDYWVRAFVAAGANWTAAETPVAEAVKFRVRAAGEIKIDVPVPDAVSKPYTGEAQLSGIGETTYYTVENPADAVNAGTYGVRLVLKNPTKYRFAGGHEDSTTVQFTITRAANYWIANPQLDPTYWYVGDTVALAPGEAKFGEATKTITWYDKSGAVFGTGADAMPTAVGEYTLKIAVPADDAGGNWSGIEYAIGFIIYEPLGVTQVGVPVLPDKEYTGATQTADIPDSPLWTVMANAGGVNAGEYTATLRLKDTTKYTWRKADGSTTPDDQEITWHITKAKNRWTTEPKVYLTSDTTKAAIFSCAVNTPVSIANGTPRFGSATKDGDITVTAVGTYLLKFTVTGTGNYEALTYELAFQVGPTSPGTEGTDTVTYQWKRNASGLWTIPDMWTASQSDLGYPYSKTAGRAIAKFDSLSKKLSGSTTDYPVEVHFSEHLPLGGLVTTADAASDITINGHRFESGEVANTIHYRHFGFNGRGTGTALSSLTVGNTRLTLMDAQYDFSYADSSIASGSTLRLFNSKHEKRSTVNPADNAFGSFEFRINKKLTLAGTARLESDDYTSYVGTLVGDGAWTMALRNRSVMRLDSFRHSTATTTYFDKGWRMNIDNSLVIAKNNLALGCGTSDSYCDDPQISVQGEHGELYATDNLRLGSDASLARPLTVNITYPGKPFSWGSFVWNYTDVNAADLKIGAPIGAGKSLTVGSNVKFVIDLTTWAAAVTNLVTVPICCANVSRDAAAYYLNVPGASGGMLTDNGALQNWYTNNFTVVGVDKAAWELRYDEASRALQLLRKGAWSYDDDLAGFKWVEGVSGRWADNARWDLGRVPNSAKNYARFLGTASYDGYDLSQQIAADLESQNWEIQLLDLSESINLLIQNGGLTVNDNDTGSQSIKIRPGTTLKFDDVRLTQKNQTVKFEFLEGANETLELANTTLIAAKGGWGIHTAKFGGNQANSLVYVHDGSYATFQYLDMTGSNGRFLAEDSNVALGGLGAQFLTIEALGASTVLKVNAWQGQSYNDPYRWDLDQHWLAADGATITLPQGTDDAKIFPNQRNTGGVVNRGKMANQLFVASNGVINASTFYLSDAKYNVTGSTTSPFSSEKANAFDPTQCSGNALRIYGRDGAFRSSGSVYLGYNGTQAGDPELTFGLPSQGWEKAPLSATGTIELRSNLQLKIDARAVKVTTKFPLASAATLSATTVANTIYDTTKTGNLGQNVEITLPDGMSQETCPCSLSIEGNTLYLTVAAGEKTSVPVPEIEPKVWNGEEQVADIEDGDEYTVEKNEGGINAGQYDVVLKLVDPDLYVWDDDLGDSAERTVQFLITQAQNEWTTKPGVNPPWWNVGGDPQPGPGTLTAGVAKYGTVSVTHSDNWNGSDMPTTEGSYWIRYAVPENANYSALSERVNFSIYPEGHAPTGDPDDAGYVYTWKYNGAGYWTVPDNWLPEKGATFGYPSAHDDIRATAKFIAQYYDSAVTVSAPGDLTTGTIWFDQGAKPVTIDMGGHTLTLVDGVNVTGVNGYGFANGTFGLQTVAFRANGTTLKVQSGTANVSALTFASQEGAATQGATIEADAGGVFAYAGDLSLGTSATTGAGTTLVLAGGQVTATGTLSFGTSTGLDAPSSIAITGASDSDVGLASAGAMTIGTANYVANESPTVAITFPAGGFATAPLRTTGEGKALTINPGTKLALDTTALAVGSYEIARAAGTLTADPTALMANATFTVKRGTKAVLEKSSDGKALCVKVSSLGLTLTLDPSEVIYDGSSWKERFTRTVTDSDGYVVAGATFEYRIKGGEWASDLTESEWTNPGEIRVRATVEGYANSPTATFTIKSRGLILFFGPAPAE